MYVLEIHVDFGLSSSCAGIWQYLAKILSRFYYCCNADRLFTTENNKTFVTYHCLNDLMVLHHVSVICRMNYMIEKCLFFIFFVDIYVNLG